MARKGGLANAITGSVSNVEMHRQMPGTTVPDHELLLVYTDLQQKDCRDRAALISRTLSVGLLKPFCKGSECFFRNNKKRTIGNVVPEPGNLQDGVKKDATSEKFSKDLAEGISISCRATDFEQIKDRDLAGSPFCTA